MDLNFSIMPSDFGEALVCWEPENKEVTALLFGDDKVDRIHKLLDLKSYYNLTLVNDDEFANGVIEKINSGKDLESISIRYLNISKFEMNVWNELRKIPMGETRSYSEIAELIGENKRSARKIAMTCRENKLAILVPCHRVIMKNGEIGGYRWGLGMKRDLLARELHKN